MALGQNVMLHREHQQQRYVMVKIMTVMDKLMKVMFAESQEVQEQKYPQEGITLVQ
jgi:hypothetical protein